MKAIRYWFGLLAAAVWLLSGMVPATAAGVAVLCYHDVGEPVTNEWMVTPRRLRAHFDHLRANGYTPISLAAYLAAARGEAELPAKPVMLTFDDGYASFYTQVLPLLKEYQYPALMSIVTGWLEYAPPGVGEMLTWQQMRELEASGLVTLASHTHQSHRYTVVNPQGDGRGLTEMRRYHNGQYETAVSYSRRVQADLRAAQAVFAEELGHPVEAIVWPYGAYTQMSVDIAGAEGFTASFILNNGGLNGADAASLRQIKRGIVTNNPSRKEFAKFLKAAGSRTAPVRAVQVDLDQIYNAQSPAQTEQNLAAVIERLLASGANTVYLQAFSDSKGDGNIESVYFATAAAPVKADLFSHAALKLKAAGFQVYAWMPTLSAQWLTSDRPEDAVAASPPDRLGWYRRATPFSPVVRERLQALYADLAAYSFIDGILFQDDLYLNDFEDYSPAAQAAFYRETGLDLTEQALREPAVRERWVRLKTDALTTLTQSLAAEVRRYRPDARTARNLYARLITEPEAQAWFAQEYAQYLQSYDYTVVMAYPYLEGAGEKPAGWLTMLTQLALQDRGHAAKTVFKLQSYDWQSGRWLAARELREQVKALQRQGALHLAYYPEAGLAIFGSQ